MGKQAYQNAKKSGYSHRNKHIHGGLLGPDPRIMPKERTVRNFDSGMVEHTRGREHQEQPDEIVTAIGYRLDG